MNTLLQEYVVPICKYNIKNNSARIEKLLGSAFFISNDGFFLTAGHIIRSIDDIRMIGLCVKEKITFKNLMAPIKNYELNNANIDIAIAKIDFQTESIFTYTELVPGYGMDVNTFGYPESALNVSPDWFGINIRTHKGYIQRLIGSGEISLLKPHLNLIEVNFPIPVGLSGSPLFAPVPIPNQKNPLLGICIGSLSTELTDYEHLEINDKKEKYSEKKIKLEQYGIAQDIRDILDWCPNLLQGASIKDKLTG